MKIKNRKAPPLPANVRQAAENIMRLIVELDDIVARLRAFEAAGRKFHTSMGDPIKTIGDTAWDLSANLLPRYLTRGINNDDIRDTRLLVELPPGYKPPTDAAGDVD